MRYTFKGWTIKDWFLGNQKTIKELIKVGIPMALAWVSLNNPIYIAIATIIGKLILDTAEYYIKE